MKIELPFFRALLGMPLFSLFCYNCPVFGISRKGIPESVGVLILCNTAVGTLLASIPAGYTRRANKARAADNLPCLHERIGAAKLFIANHLCSIAKKIIVP